MGLFDKLERRLEQTVNGAFAKAFRAEVQPVEIASSMRRAMDNRASSISRGQRPIVPNVFDVELSKGDFERLTAYRDELSDELIASAMEHADTQRYTAGGPMAVTFTENVDLETGVFHVHPSTAKNIDNLEPLHPAEESDAPEAQPEPEQAPSEPGRLGTAYAAAEHGSPPDSASAAETSPGPSAPDRRAAEPAPAAPKPPPPRPRKARPWLDLDGERYPLLSARTTIGRDDSADIILDDPGISRLHSEVRVTYDGPHLVVTLQDLDSTNGTYVNGDPVARARLLDGDRITIGRTTFTIRMGGRR